LFGKKHKKPDESLKPLDSLNVGTPQDDNPEDPGPLHDLGIEPEELGPLNDLPVVGSQNNDVEDAAPLIDLDSALASPNPLSQVDTLSNRGDDSVQHQKPEVIQMPMSGSGLGLNRDDSDQHQKPEAIQMPMSGAGLGLNRDDKDEHRRAESVGPTSTLGVAGHDDAGSVQDDVTPSSPDAAAENLSSPSISLPGRDTKPAVPEMSGSGLNIVKKVGSLRGEGKGLSLGRSFRSVASNAGPMNILRELSCDPSREIKLGEMLRAKKVITETQFNEAVKMVEDTASDKSRLAPISIVYELQSVELSNMDHIINCLAEESKTPLIELSCFKVKNEIFTKLPPDIAERLGAVLFGSVGRAKQVALVNPCDPKVREAICNYLETKEISFYLIHPEEITPFYDKLRAQLAEL